MAAIGFLYSESAGVLRAIENCRQSDQKPRGLDQKLQGFSLEGECGAWVSLPRG
jgi:hypothetical protein